MLVQDAANTQIRLYRTDGNTVSDSAQRVHLDAAPAALKFWR